VIFSAMSINFIRNRGILDAQTLKKEKHLFCFLQQPLFSLLNLKLTQLQGILFFCLLFEFKETYG
jgi:hypothetical protein